MTREGLGIRSTARVLQISTTTLLKRILLIAKNIKQPIIPMGKEYEVDELCTYVGDKNRRTWLVCALERQSRNIVNFNVGTRTNQTLRKLTENLHLSRAKKIFTDKLPSYRTLIEKKVHKIVRYGTNHLERFHLTLSID
ncbi:IS1 family transposase [Chryseobacterium defluvii]|uniref:IS1 family transposase n=1 Tax=Chryseobacterium defluvii TaxID=160396 RepID=A0A840KDX4_9FLAO|nr:IS1 family transposase [Chryseobacterium defluvii]